MGPTIAARLGDPHLDDAFFERHPQLSSFVDMLEKRYLQADLVRKTTAHRVAEVWFLSFSD
jgi:hypothetical protein